jgi:hypothetical protein
MASRTAGKMPALRKNSQQPKSREPSRTLGLKKAVPDVTVTLS